jgi:hypothetical protein
MTEEQNNVPYDEVERGKYVSLLEDHPGFVRFPVPLTGRHYKAREKALQEAKDKEMSAMEREWCAALPIIDEWQIEGVPQSDVEESGDNVPLEVINWVRLVSIKYILDAVSLKNLRAPSETT